MTSHIDFQVAFSTASTRFSLKSQQHFLVSLISKLKSLSAERYCQQSWRRDQLKHWDWHIKSFKCLTADNCSNVPTICIVQKTKENNDMNMQRRVRHTQASQREKEMCRATDRPADRHKTAKITTPTTSMIINQMDYDNNEVILTT